MVDTLRPDSTMQGVPYMRTDPEGAFVSKDDYDALQAKHDNLAWNLDGCMESINNLSAQKDALAAEMNAWFKDEAKFYGLPYDGERKSSVAKLGGRIRALEAELAEANAGRDKPITRDVESALRISALEELIIQHNVRAMNEQHPDWVIPIDTKQIAFTAETACEHNWQEVDAYPFKGWKCTKCGATKT